MESNNPFKAPKSNLSTQENNEKKVTFGIRYFHGFCWGIVLLILLVGLSRSKAEWFSLAMIIAVVALSLVTGLVSGLIPSRRKIIYIPISVVLVFTGLYFIGTSSNY